MLGRLISGIITLCVLPLAVVWGVLKGFFSLFLRSPMPTEEVIEKTKFFLSGQIKHLEENSSGYEHRLGQKGIYYILCLAEAIALRPIDDDELMLLVSNCFDPEKAILIYNHFLMTKSHISAHIDIKNEMKRLAQKDAQNGMIQSSNFLVQHDQIVQKSIAEMFKEPVCD